MDHGWKCIGRCHYDHISSKSPAAFYNIQVNGILHEKPRLSLLHDPKIMDKPEVCSRTRKYTCNFCCIDYRQKLSQVITLFLSNLLRSSQCWFLVGAFLGKSARYLQWLVFFLFFVRLQSHSDWATFLTIETTKITTIRPSLVSGN